MIKFDFNNYIKDFITKEEIEEYDSEIPKIQQFLNDNKEMMGWHNLDNLFSKEIINDVNEVASYIRENCDVFLIIGIGGSYLGSKAIVEALKPYFYNNDMKPQMYFVGTSLSSDYYHDLINLIKEKDIIINVISKSGATLETEIFYNLIIKEMAKKYSPEELKRRVIVTTSKDKGQLRKEVIKEGYKSFIIPDDIGGRYSVFSPAGLLPMAVSNLDIDKLSEGANNANNDIQNQIKYAVTRKIMYKKGKVVEAFVTYEPKLLFFMEWLKQLYAESLGKENKGILPISLINTRDLHSLGQFIQDGKKILFETVINVEESNNDIYIEKYNKTLNEINNIASTATSKAHLKGQVPNNIITIRKLNEFTMGYLLQFFMISCSISGCLENINPFSQDGVEEYKKIIKESLQK